MTAVSVNILQNNLVGSKELTNIVTRRVHYTFVRQFKVHTTTHDKVGLTCSTSSGNRRCGFFAEHTRSLTSFVVYIHQVFVLMRRIDKNLNSTHKVCSTSTANARNSVLSKSKPTQPTHPLLRLTKKQLLGLLESEAIEATSRDAFYSLALSAFLEWCECEERDSYCTTVRDERLLGKLSAMRTAFAPIKSNRTKL